MSTIATSPAFSPKQAYPWRTLVASELAAVDQEIKDMTTVSTSLITGVVQHIVQSGGKRLRPILTLLSSRLCGYTEGDRHIKLAACIEFIHTATLLHDDVVDESALRRGKKTANDVWGNAASVLVGDFLLSRSFQLMARDGSLKVLEILSDTSAIITEGEVKQLTASNDISLTREHYLDIITAKTAELFAAACRIGAVITSETEEKEQALDSFGRSLGIAFQIVDDALDYSADQQALGKSIGDDFREGKVTLPLIICYQEGTSEEKSFWEQNIENPGNEAALPKALELMKKYNATEKTLDVAREYQQQALQALQQFPESEEKQALDALLQFSVERDY